MLSISGLPKSTFFFELSNENDYLNRNYEVVNEIKEMFYKHNGNYGVRRITESLKKKSIRINHKKVQKIMRMIGLKGKTPKSKYHSFQGQTCVVADNLINRNFLATKPNQKWSTDVSQFSLGFGKCYLSPILDMADGRIVSYDLSMNPNYEQIERMLSRAFEGKGDLTGLIIHSDMGWQYHNPRYIRALKDHGIIQSMSRKGNCYDNCIIESFFGHMKNEMFYGREFEYKSFEELSKAVDDYISYYNGERINSKCKYFSPNEYNRILISNT